MKRNRSIRTLPLENLDLLKHPQPETSGTYYNHETLCFGEEIFKESPPNYEKIFSSDGSGILTSVGDLDNGKSSSSSLSWGEEYKSGASRQVRDELERMDRVLRGVESIPDHYDCEEYKEWMDFFPNLCAFGTKMKIKSLTESKNRKNCERVVNNRVQISAPKSDSFLKVSPLGDSLLACRQSSSRSLISSQISSSKWLKDEELNCLPFLPESKGKKGTKGILKNSLVLPPIEKNQFRSISATPRRETKMSDQKHSGFKRKIK